MKRLISGGLAVAALAFSFSATAATKWHPGHYVILDGYSSQSAHFTQINEVANVGAVKGVVLRLWWYELEPSKGSYNFSRINTYLTKLKSLPTSKRLIVRVMDRRFGSSTPGTRPRGIIPDYLLNQSIYNGGIVAMSHGYTARIWEQPVMDRLIALYRAMGARYNGDMWFEGINSEETAMSFGSNKPASYTPEKLRYQFQRLVANSRSAMPNTNIFINTNWLGTVSNMGTLVQSFLNPNGALGSSNLVPNTSKLNHGQKVWTGGAGADYRGRLAISNGVEAGELGGNLGNYTPKQIGDFAYNYLRVNHVFWTRNTWMGSSGQRWSTGILPYLKTNPPVRTNCPVEYGSCKK